MARFMMIVKATEESEAGVLPTKELVAEMGQYNEQLVKAGALLAADGLKASSEGARVSFSGGRPTVTDGPFAETKELIAGFWIIQVKDRDEALEWARRVPFQDGEIEVRPVFEPTDFPEDVLSPECAEREAAMRESLREQR
ncbi:YciI family protein [Streptomyces sp. NPDC051162]|uniref:YciI family protein n=1 Tax=unclassified Streptomyces TaxID=2593676 RepID=UPI00341EDC7E